MNIFWLSIDPDTAAHMMCDKHVVKIILEVCQMLWCAHHKTGADGWKQTVPDTIKIYKQTHSSHPMAIWIRKSQYNYIWACQYALAIGREYTERYGRTHKCQIIAEWLYSNIPPCDTLDEYGENTVLATLDYPLHCTPPPITITNKKCIKPSLSPSLVLSYREYYLVEKYSFCTWKNTFPPIWYLLKNSNMV